MSTKSIDDGDPGQPGRSLQAATSPKARVIGWLLDGARDDDVAAQIAAEFPYLRKDDLIASVVEHFEEVAAAEKAVFLGWALEAMRDVYRRAIAAADFDVALRALKEFASLAQRTPGVRTEADPAEKSTADRPKQSRRRKMDRAEPGGGC